MGDCLATIDMGRKLGACPFSLGGSWVPSNTMSPGPRSASIPSGILIHQPFGHNRHGPKIGGCCALFRGRAGSSSNTVWPGPRPTPVWSFSSPIISRRRLDVYHTSTHGVALVRILDAGLKIQDAKIPQNWPSVHHRTALSGYIFATKARIDNRKNLLNSNLPTCPYNMVNFGH